MKIIRIISYIAASVAFLCIPVVANAELSEPLLKYKSACETMKQALDSKDKNRMHEALDMLDSIDIACMADDSYTVASGQYSAPSVYFLADYADNLLLKDFVIAELDDTSLLRDTSLASEVSVIHCGLKANSGISFDIEGDGHMEVLVFSDSRKAPKIKVSDLTSGEKYENYTIDGASSSLVWNMSGSGMFEISVENDSDKDATIVIALN